jgi:hypothetical protein
MKTYWIIIIFLFSFTGTANSQSNKAFYAQEITWFGLDFSQAYFIDDVAFPNPTRLKDELFLEWNNFVFKEPRKFDIKKAFNKRGVSYSTSYINSRNEEVNINKRVGNFWLQENYFNGDTIQNIVASYNLLKNNSGVGLVFIVESLDKPNKRGIYWVTFFDIETKKVLLTEQIIGIPGGAGLRNYWANSFYSALIKAGRTMGFIF